MIRVKRSVLWGVAAAFAAALLLGTNGCDDASETKEEAEPIERNGTDGGQDAASTNRRDSAAETESQTEDDGGTDSAVDAAGHRPIVFVHGGVGSADQFQSQALRFASNGFPASYITGYEYDSVAASGGDEAVEAQVMDGIDAHIDAVLAETGAKQVDLLGHSLGTQQCQNYLRSSPERAAKVAHYVNLDGRAGDDPPGGVDTLAIWAGMSAYKPQEDPETGEPTGDIIHLSDEERGQIGGAKNVVIRGITHVQAATCTESFVEIYKFFNNGEEPDTTAVLPEDSDSIELAGRVVYFAYNNSPQDFTLEMYEIDDDTGTRLDDAPAYTTSISGNGEFGPIDAQAGVRYEFVIFDEENRSETTLHFYYEPFIRSDYLLRLKTSQPGSTVTSNLERSDNNTNLVIVRNMEFVGDAEKYADEEDLRNDSLTVNDVELCTEILSPASNRTIGMFVTDVDSDDETDLSQWIEGLASIPFLSGADLFLPASDPPDDPITIVVKNRTVSGVEQVLTVPNWVSAEHRISVQFNDFVQ